MVGVSKAFQANKQVLKNIYLSFFYGAKIGIIGLNGSGKSTLLAILAGLDDGSSGEVNLVGQPLHNMDEEARAKLRAKHVRSDFIIHSSLKLRVRDK